MTIQELVDWCIEHEIDMENTHIAMRAKDDYFLTAEKLYMDGAYFGNCNDGEEWEDTHRLDGDGEYDFDKPVPEVLILDTGRG